MAVVLWAGVCAVLLVIAGSVAGRVRIRRFRAGVYVNGNVIDRTRHTVDLGGDHYTIRFGYAVEGEYFHVTQAVNRHLYDGYTTGARIGVRYLPGDPAKARIDATL